MDEDDNTGSIVLRDLDPLILEYLDPSDIRALYKINKYYRSFLKQIVWEINEIKLLDSNDGMERDGTYMTIFTRFIGGVSSKHEESSHKSISIAHMIKDSVGYILRKYPDQSISNISKKKINPKSIKAFEKGYIWPSYYILRKYDISDQINQIICASSQQKSLDLFKSVVQKTTMEEMTSCIESDNLLLHKIIQGGNLEIIKYWIQIMETFGNKFVLRNEYFLNAVNSGSLDVFKYLMEIADEASFPVNIHTGNDQFFQIACEKCADESFTRYLLELGETRKYGPRFFIGRFSTIVKNAYKNHKFEQCDYLLDLFEQTGYKPKNKPIANALNAFCKEGDMNRVKRIMQIGNKWSLDPSLSADVIRAIDMLTYFIYNPIGLSINISTIRNDLLIDIQRDLDFVLINKIRERVKGSDRWLSDLICSDRRIIGKIDEIISADCKYIIRTLCGDNDIVKIHWLRLSEEIDKILAYIVTGDHVGIIHNLCTRKEWITKIIVPNLLAPLCRAFELACRSQKTYMARVILDYITKFASDYLIYPIISEQLLVDRSEANDVTTVRFLLEALVNPKQNYIGNYLNTIPIVSYFSSYFSIYKPIDRSILILCKSLADEAGFQEMSSLLEPYI